MKAKQKQSTRNSLLLLSMPNYKSQAVPTDYHPNNKPPPTSSMPPSDDLPPPPPPRTHASILPPPVVATVDRCYCRSHYLTRGSPTDQTHCSPRHTHPPRSSNRVNDSRRRQSTPRFGSSTVPKSAWVKVDGSHRLSRVVRPCRDRRRRDGRIGWIRGCDGRRLPRLPQESLRYPFGYWMAYYQLQLLLQNHGCWDHLMTNSAAAHRGQTFRPSWVCN
mmetsp:Transcript_8752/g.15359  ORF Transcript_8752/g.15359 Transcript_8752/m.15359 type:complete len:218 (+) Transcript_8752:593-1246(+)